MFIGGGSMVSNPGNHDVVAADVHIELRKRLWWRPRDVLPIQIKYTVVTRANDNLVTGIILDCTVQVRATRRISP
jgi:hypothetical protein